MRNLVRIALVAALALPAVALAQITNSRHDLSSTSSQTHKSAQTQLCIFCHTPHRAIQQQLIWNHTAVTNPRGWAAGNNLTAEGTTLPADISSESKRCLACHDGSLSIGDVNNVGGGSTGTIPLAVQNTILAGYQTATATGTNDMVNNHPVSIPYASNTAAYNGITTGVAVATGVGNYQAATNTSCQSPSGVCTDKATDGVYINLKGTVAAAGVECGTCHEPHNKYGTNAYFLRVTESGSRLCLACHNK